MRTASRKATKEILRNQCKTNEEKMHVVLQSARAVTFNDKKLLKHVQRDFPELGKTLGLDDDDKVNFPSRHP